MHGGIRVGLRVALSAALVFGGLGASAATAQAGSVAPAGPGGLLLPFEPFDCHTKLYTIGFGQAVCEQGGGEHRAKVRCDRNNWFDYDRYGPWRPNRVYSTAWCDGEDEAKDLWVEKRQWT